MIQDSRDVSARNRIGVYRRIPQGGINRNSLAAILVLLSAACADLRWHKADADAAATERDIAECQARARSRAQHEAPLFGMPRPPVIGTDVQGRIVTGQAGRHDTDRAMLEHDFMRACMRERGYELAPAAKP